MKRTAAIILSLVALVVACQKDDITVVSDTTSGNTSGNDDNGADTPPPSPPISTAR